MQLITRVIERIEGRAVPLQAAAATFAAIVLVRNQLENALEKSHLVANNGLFYQDFLDLIHIMLSWGTLFLLPILALSFTLGRDIGKVTNVVLFAFPLITMVPIVDALTGNSGYISYQHEFGAFASSFLNLFNPHTRVDYVTFGVRVEVFLFLVLVLLYAICGDRSPWRWVKAVLLGGFVYLVIFVVGFLPAIWAWVFSLSSEQMLALSVLSMTPTKAKLIWYLPIFIPALLIYLARRYPEGFKAALSALRPNRLLVYLLLLNLGFVSAAFTGLVDYDWINPLDVGVVILMNCALVCAFISQVVLNDWHDLEIDRISNPDRPLVKESISPSAYRALGTCTACSALVLSSIIQDTSFMVMLAILALGFLYSAPPFRLRSVPFLSHALLASISVSVILLGTVVVHGNLSVQQANGSMVGVIAVLFFIGTHFKDVKDEYGDRQNRVITLATILGGRVAFWTTGAVMILACSACILAGALPGNVLTWGALGLFVSGLVLLRDAEKMFWVMAPAAAMIIYSGM